MKTKIFSLCSIVVAAATLLTGCVTPYGEPDRTATGALVGGGSGAALGAILGGRHSGEGALIGGAIGAITGGLIGHSMDQDAAARLRTQAPVTYQRIDQGQPLGVADVKAMAQARISDEVIISQIRNTHTVYRLSAADIIDLNNSGVSQKVIDYMINTPRTNASYEPVQTSAVVAQAPPPRIVETYVSAPAPGFVWIGGDWNWSGGRWAWTSGYWCRPPYPSAIWIRGSWSRGSHGWHRAPGHWRH